ncbi:hypothetical protein B0T36_00665 [Nocardia donostiensis]|uniref:serine/threonine-protein kinase n=1 Tax=Nocardia donostiensis TaxID=1538463 RepID=UPI0009DB69A5|nr:serine/threonine-protein kinase [Nocardia donostiensis]OQS17165.1 hypothetical protein B0T36_00665 [Nocardia donostiensis]
MGQTLAQGQIFAGYRIERLLGVGGMGEVYLAQDRDLPRWVALKLLGGAVTNDPDVRARFQREADTAARLAHPNIVTVYARGDHEGQLWIAMEYVDGTDVGAVLRNGPLPPEHAVWIITETARALDHAHRNGILHRDVKPANILLARGGGQERVLLADFGIAKALDDSVSITRTGEVYASFRYAAPEQFDGASEIDRRTDVYALGGTLHHMLTGDYPFPATSTGQLIHSHLNLPAPQPCQQNPALPSGFDAVIARAMAKDRAHRFDSCGELAAVAADALNRVHVPPPVTPRSTSAPRSRSRAVLISAAVLATVAVLGGAGTAVVMATGNAREAQQLSNRQAEEKALEARACDITGKLLTVDYRDFDTFEKLTKENTTGEYKNSFLSSSSTWRDLYSESEVVSKTSDLRCYYKSGDASQAQVLVTGKRTITNAGFPEPKIKPLSAVMTLDNVDGRWLCSKLELTDQN